MAQEVVHSIFICLIATNLEQVADVLYACANLTTQVDGQYVLCLCSEGLVQLTV